MKLDEYSYMAVCFQRKLPSRMRRRRKSSRKETQPSSCVMSSVPLRPPSFGSTKGLGYKWKKTVRWRVQWSREWNWNPTTTFLDHYWCDNWSGARREASLHYAKWGFGQICFWPNRVYLHPVKPKMKSKFTVQCDWEINIFWKGNEKPKTDLYCSGSQIAIHSWTGGKLHTVFLHHASPSFM